VWGFFCLLSVFLIYLSPYVIEPLFVKFEPVTDPELVPQVRELARRAGFSVSKVLKMDASRRTAHSNAYFTGIGRVKRIVLFDTLLDQMSRPEIVAVLAHEAGHWKKMHIPQRLAATALVSLAGFYLAHVLLSYEGLPGWVGLESGSFYARVLILALAGSVVSFFMTPLAAAVSRFQERQADRYACDLTRNPQAMGSALATLTKENLSNLHPHPVYAWFTYSHPPVVQRIKDLA
jgi:STE24 endopeptidase